MLNQVFITVAGAAALALPIATVADHVGGNDQNGVAGKSPVAQVVPQSSISAGTEVQVPTTTAPRLVSEIPSAAADGQSSNVAANDDPTLEVAPASNQPVVIRHVKVSAGSVAPGPVAASTTEASSAASETVAMMARVTDPADPAQNAPPTDKDPALAGAPASDSAATVVPGPAQTAQEVYAALSPYQRAAREAAQGQPWWIQRPGQPPLTQAEINAMAPNGLTGFETPVPRAGNLSLNDTMAAFEARYRNGQVVDTMGYAAAYKAAVDAWYAANS